MRALRAHQPRQDEALADAVRVLAGGGHILAHRQRPWASACFSGARHYFTLALPGGEPAAQALAAAVPDHDFALATRFVAEAAVTGHVDGQAGAVKCFLEVLTVDEV